MITRALRAVTVGIVAAGVSMSAIACERDDLPEEVARRNDRLARELRAIPSGNGEKSQREVAVSSEGELVARDDAGSGRAAGYLTDLRYRPESTPAEFASAVVAELRRLGFEVTRLDKLDAGADTAILIDGNGATDDVHFFLPVLPTSSVADTRWNGAQRVTARITSTPA